MTDRVIVYPASIPQDVDLLNTNQNMMIALGYLARLIFGSQYILIDGLVCTTTTTANEVYVGQGVILSDQVLEATAYGSLAADTTDPLMKLGINPRGSTAIAVVVPATSGYSVNYLIEAAFSEVDSNATVLPYYNVSNPTQPYAGPNNNNVSQNTLRAEIVEVTAKAGTPATTGTQLTPAPDVGYIGLWVVTLNYGQTWPILSTQIVAYSPGHFLGSKLSTLGWRGAYWTDTGTANTMAITLTPPPATLTALTGCPFLVKVAVSNTGATTINVDGLGATAVITPNGSALTSGRLTAGGIYELIYNGTSFMLLTPNS